MLRLTDELAPADITKQTQQDLTFIAEFLCNFDGATDPNATQAPDPAGDSCVANQANPESTSGKVPSRPGLSTPGRKTRFNLERLGQYLVDQELTFLPDTDSNPWNNLLSEYPSLNEDPLIIPHFR